MGKTIVFSPCGPHWNKAGKRGLHIMCPLPHQLSQAPKPSIFKKIIIAFLLGETPLWRDWKLSFPIQLPHVPILYGSFLYILTYMWQIFIKCLCITWLYKYELNPFHLFCIINRDINMSFPNCSKLLEFPKCLKVRTRNKPINHRPKLLKIQNLPPLVLLPSSIFPYPWLQGTWTIINHHGPRNFLQNSKD